ncbi:MAG TPA: hypothetical protein VGL72_27200 [Bryobacteraceae bacterium]|jgi:DNA-binding NarL/FixJ family response regulator
MWKITRPFERPSTNGSQALSDDNAPSVLLITADDDYRVRWQKLFTAHHWQLSCERSLTQAMQTLSHVPFPVVVYDCQSGNEDWRAALEALCQSPDPPCVLLVSSVVDENFRDDVVRNHGYDVFSRRADEDEIARTINSAWFWKHRHV